MTENKGGILIGPRCSNRCDFCISGHGIYPTQEEFRKQEIGVFKDLMSYKKKGYEQIEISGSDPIEYTKIAALIRYIKKLGFKKILFNTHGRNLHDIEFARELIKAGITTFRIPLYGSRAEIHDSVTNVKGSFDETIEGIKNIKKVDDSINLILHTLILKENKDDLLDMFMLAEKLGRNQFDYAVQYLANEDHSHYVPYKELIAYISKVFKHVDDNKIQGVDFHDIPHCVFGKKNSHIVRSFTPDMGEYNQHAETVQSHIKNLPKYRLKKKLEMCKECSVQDECDGFLINDVDYYGTGNLKPIP